MATEHQAEIETQQYQHGGTFIEALWCNLCRQVSQLKMHTQDDRQQSKQTVRARLVKMVQLVTPQLHIEKVDWVHSNQGKIVFKHEAKQKAWHVKHSCWP